VSVQAKACLRVFTKGSY